MKNVWKGSKADRSLIYTNAGWTDKVFSFTVIALLVLVSFIIAYPLYFVLIASFSDPSDMVSGRTLLFPISFYWDGYKAIFNYREIWISYLNTILYTVSGTALHLVITIPIAYTMSRKRLLLGNFLSTYLLITMFFSGGTIPTYLAMKSYHLLNTRWVMIIAGCVSVYNIIVSRTFFASTIPDELVEAAEIDGASEIETFIKIVLPNSATIIAVIGLYAAVSYWNSYMTGLMYLRNRNYMPLQVILRELLMVNMQIDLDPMSAEDALRKAEQIKYGIIVVSALPLMVLYPCLQRFFEKGVMIGAIKG